MGALWAPPPSLDPWMEVLGRMRGLADRAAAQILALASADEEGVCDTLDSTTYGQLVSW